MTKQEQIACSCNGTLESIDSHGSSSTMWCKDCGRCTLVVAYSSNVETIQLADFHLKRGDGPSLRRLDDFTMATSLVNSLMNDMWPSTAILVDYGINCTAHYAVLQHAVRSGRTAYDLDRVMGDGPAITKLVHCVPTPPIRRIQFETAYDGFLELTDH